MTDIKCFVYLNKKPIIMKKLLFFILIPVLIFGQDDMFSYVKSRRISDIEKALEIVNIIRKYDFNNEFTIDKDLSVSAEKKAKEIIGTDGELVIDDLPENIGQTLFRTRDYLDIINAYDDYNPYLDAVTLWIKSSDRDGIGTSSYTKIGFGAAYKDDDKLGVVVVVAMYK